METSERLMMVAATCVLIAGLATATSARIIYVDDDAVGTADGTSWSNAFPFLLEALAVAGPGDELRVAQGTYKPNQGVTAKPYPPGRGHGSATPSLYSPFRPKGDLTIRGGFASVGADDPNARDVKRFETILSGDLNGDDAAGWSPGDPVYRSARTDNNRIVVESGAAVLDGLVIQSSTQSGLDSTDGSPRVRDCTFRWNSGAGFHCARGQAVLEKCLFRENSSGIGVHGATFRTTHGQETVLARLTLLECRFIDNGAETSGAIYAASSRLSLTGCSFDRNSTAMGGGAIAHSGGSLVLSDCRFESNEARSTGGAVSLWSLETATLVRCLFRNNRAVWGGAISNREGPLILDSDIFSGNQAQFGGAVEAVAPSWSTRPPGINDILMRGCLFTGNRGLESGGALYAGPRANFTITSCTFADNWARTAGRPGDAAFQVTMDNTILWEGSESIAPALYASTHSAARSPSVTIRYSDVRGGWLGEGNIDADPLFSSPGRWADSSHPGVAAKPNDPNAVWIEGDYHLKSQVGCWDPVKRAWTQDAVTSPCIDAGDPGSPFAHEPQPSGGRINLGAYGGTAEASKSLVR